MTPPNDHEFDDESRDENAMAPPTDLNVGTPVPDPLGGDGDNPVDQNKVEKTVADEDGGVDEGKSADEVDLSGGAENASAGAGNSWDK